MTNQHTSPTEAVVWFDRPLPRWRRWLLRVPLLRRWVDNRVIWRGELGQSEEDG